MLKRFEISILHLYMYLTSRRYHRLLVELQFFQVTLVEKFVSHEFGHFMLHLPRFRYCTDVTSGHQNTAKHWKKPVNSLEYHHVT